MRILLVGHGKMGKLVESLAAGYGCEVAGIVDSQSVAPIGADFSRAPQADVAIDFSTPAAVGVNAPALARRGMNLVIGTTGWQKDEAAIRAAVEQFGTGCRRAEFSTGVVIFDAVVAHAAKLFAAQDEFGAFVHEAHHATKKDAPSGTALSLKRSMEAAGFTRPIDVASTRAGHIPGTHTVGFDGPAESIALTHTARDRTAFARGALVAAQWIKGKRGWYTMRDVLGI